MSSRGWGERMASVVTACGPRAGTQQNMPYHRRLEKVKFGVPMDQVCKKDIPGPLLVMLLKLNKEGPFKKDVFRAPGHQGNMRKLIHFLQNGRLVNIDSYSVNTIASVLKKFLRKIPGGIFGPENEAKLFEIIKVADDEEKLQRVQKVLLSLPDYSQQLLVLLFGTFRVIHSNCESAQTGMTAEAIGVSVAPSFFHTCVLAGKTAKMEDVERFKLATKVTTFFIDHFGMRALFGRDNYEYYARLTGRILKVEDEWIFFTYPLGFSSPPVQSGIPAGAGAAPAKTRDDMDKSLECRSEERAGTMEKTGSLEIIPENCPLDPKGRLSISLDDQNVSSPSSCGSPSVVCSKKGLLTAVAEVEMRIGRGARHEQKPVTCLPQWDHVRRHSASVTLLWPACARQHHQKKPETNKPGVHQRQTERMKHRSEWFLSDPTGLVTVKCSSFKPPPTHAHCDTTTRLPPLDPTLLRRRLSDRDKERRLVRRSSSKRKDDKENGGKDSPVSLSARGSSSALASMEETAMTHVASSPTMATQAQLSASALNSALLQELVVRPGLKRTGSADDGGASGSLASSLAQQQRHHAALCRTGSQDNSTPPTPQQHLKRAMGSQQAAITRSMPRI